MKTQILITSLLLLAIINLSAQTLEWAKSMGGTGNEYGNSMAIDALGNVYTVGNYMGTVDFNPGTGTFNLTSVGLFDIFISKLDASGNFVFAKSMGGPLNDWATSIALSGNIYTTGYFYGTADFDPGAGTFNLTSSNDSSDIFISNLDASGNFVYAKSMGGTSSKCYSQSITIDASGNVYTTGYFSGTSDFDPGTGVFNLTTTGVNDIFISKLDASGNFVWAKSMGGNI